MLPSCHCYTFIKNTLQVTIKISQWWTDLHSATNCLTSDLFCEQFHTYFHVTKILLSYETLLCSNNISQWCGIYI